jgi:hypothetical protein
VIIKRLLTLPRKRLLIITTSIIMTLIFIIEALTTFLRVLSPPLPGMGELVLNTLFLSIATILTLYLFLFRSWVRAPSSAGRVEAP